MSEASGADKVPGDLVIPSFLGFKQEPESYYWEHSSNLDRGFLDYCEELGFDLRIFAEKKILDLGAGVTGRFGREAAELGLDVTSTNPNWRDEEYVERFILSSGPNHVPDWELDASKLTLAIQDEEWSDFESGFDVVLSMYAVPMYLKGTLGMYRRSFRNLHAILRPGGIALLNPVPRGIHQMSEFHDVLRAKAPDYELLGNMLLAKLMIKKDFTERDEAAITDVRDGLINADATSLF
jgi:cyclopropane fatty-acyl-phospholipid synthase-like methyltransferase